MQAPPSGTEAVFPTTSVALNTDIPSGWYNRPWVRFKLKPGYKFMTDSEDTIPSELGGDWQLAGHGKKEELAIGDENAANLSSMPDDMTEEEVQRLSVGIVVGALNQETRDPEAHM